VGINTAFQQNALFCLLQNIIDEDTLAIGESRLVFLLFSYKKWWYGCISIFSWKTVVSIFGFIFLQKVSHSFWLRS